MPKRFLLLCLSCASLALAPIAGKAADAYDLNVILPLSGSAAFLGKSHQLSIQLAERLTNDTGGIAGHPLHVVFADDQSSPQTALQLLNQAVADKPAIIMGSVLVAICNAMAPLMRDGPVEWCFSPALHPAAGSYVFTSGIGTHDLIEATVRYFRLRGWTKLAVLTSTDASGQDADRGIDDALKRDENRQVAVVAHEHFNTSDISVAAQIETIRAARPQAFIAWSTGTPAGTVFRGAAQAGLDVPMATTDGNMTHVQMKQYAAFLPKELYIPSSAWTARGSGIALPPDVKAAQDRFYAAYAEAHMVPDVAATGDWDPMGMIVAALRRLGTGATAAQLHDDLMHIKGYAGINGIYDFERIPQRGLDISNVVITRWTPAANTWVPVSAPTGALLP
jgi:branched-chain amino acid transport system substrate-binding protein